MGEGIRVGEINESHIKSHIARGYLAQDQCTRKVGERGARRRDHLRPSRAKPRNPGSPPLQPTLLRLPPLCQVTLPSIPTPPPQPTTNSPDQSAFFESKQLHLSPLSPHSHLCQVTQLHGIALCLEPCVCLLNSRVFACTPHTQVVGN